MLFGAPLSGMVTVNRTPAKFLLMAGASLALSGCGANLLRVEYAGNVAKYGVQTKVATQQFLQGVVANRRDLAAELISLDPKCMQNTVYFYEPPLVSADRKSISLCYADSRQAPPTASKLDLSSPKARFVPVGKSLAVLSAYTEALAQIVDTPPPDVAGAIGGAVKDAGTVNDFLAAVGVDTGIALDADEPHLKAITGLLTMIGKLAHEQSQVDELRQVAAADKGEAATVIAMLRESVGRWDNVTRSETDVTRKTAQMIARLAVQQTAPGAFAERRAMIETLNVRLAELDKEQQIGEAALDVLKALEAANSDFLRILRDSKSFTPAERARRASINRRRALDALQSLTQVLTAFKGI